MQKFQRLLHSTSLFELHGVPTVTPRTESGKEINSHQKHVSFSQDHTLLHQHVFVGTFHDPNILGPQQSLVQLPNIVLFFWSFNLHVHCSPQKTQGLRCSDCNFCFTTRPQLAVTNSRFTSWEKKRSENAA